MKKSLLTAALLCASSWLSTAWAQLSSNPDKFLGNITTRYNVDTDGFTYWKFWNQITPENESKWGSVEGTRGSFNWGGADKCVNYAKNHKFPFKFHAIIWGAQHPGWFNENLSIAERKKAIISWMDNMKKHYPTLDLIDVANECVAGHQADTYLFEEALGGGGETGWDWLIYAFKEAHKRWPEAILIYNDFNTFQWNTDQYISLVTALRDGGAPIDAYGCQSHDLTDCSKSNFTSSCTKIQNALKMPMYISEYDIGTSDDNLQLQRYKEQIPYMWEADYCAGITLWGWIYGSTWTTDGNSGIIKNGKDRPAMTWLKEYMASNKAKAAKSPYPGMKKPISLYIVPEKYKPSINEETTITVDAKMHNGNTIEKVEFYVGSKLTETLTEAPYEIKYSSATKGKKSFKAIVYDSEGNKYERLGGVQVIGPRSPFKGEPIALPGTIEAEDFDKGDDGIAFHDSDTQNQGTSAYRTDGGGVDIVTGNGGYAIGYTAQGEWLEYTVDIKQAGTYEYEAVASSGATNSSFSIALNDNGKLTTLAGPLLVPCVTQGNWDTYNKISGRCAATLPEGKYAIRLTINGANCNIDKVKFTHIDINNDIKMGISATPAPVTVNTTTTIKVNATCASANIAKVQLYINGTLKKTMTSAPYEYAFKPTATGKYEITAIATDENGAKSQIAAYTLNVNPKRTPFKGVIDIPGIIEAENFDKCGEGASFHDSDSKDEGNCGYRTDNEGVDIVLSDNRYVLGYTAANEWTEYTVNVAETGKYSYKTTASNGASASGGFTVSLVEDDGSLTKLFTRSIATTGGWDTYKVYSGNITKEIPAGQHILRITLNNPANCNIDKIEFILKEVTPITDAEAEVSGTYTVYTLAGTLVGEIECDNPARLSSQLYQLTGNKAIYLLHNKRNGKAIKVMAQ